MSEFKVETQGTIGNTRQDSVITAEELKMKAEVGSTRAIISKVLGTSIGTRFLRVAILGTLVLGAASLITGIEQVASAREMGRSQVTQSASSVVDLGTANPELAELPYDELSKNFFGIPATGNQPSRVALVTSNFDYQDDPAELVYDEMSHGFFGIPAAGNQPSRVALVTSNFDYQDDPAELVYDEMSHGFFGIPSAGNQPSRVALVISNFDYQDDPAELVYDEMSHGFFGIPAAGD